VEASTLSWLLYLRSLLLRIFSEVDAEDKLIIALWCFMFFPGLFFSATEHFSMDGWILGIKLAFALYHCTLDDSSAASM